MGLVCVLSVNQLDKPNSCGKATGILSVVKEVTAGTDLHRMCNIFGKSNICSKIMIKILTAQIHCYTNLYNIAVRS